jgi:uncharacterized protein (DUF2141 family)
MRRPSLLTARSDLELLYSATQHFQRFTLESPRNKNIASLIVAMYHAATNFVSQARVNPGTMGPESTTAENLQHQFHELPHGKGTIKSSNEFEYSPTPTIPMDQIPTMNTSSSGMHQSPYGFATHGHEQYGRSDPVGPHMMSEAEAAAMLAAQQGEYLTPGMSPFPDMLGMAIGGGWDDWTWHNEARQPSG